MSDYFNITPRPPQGRDLGKYVGIEIECLTGSWDDLARRFDKAGVKNTIIKDDGSVEGEGEPTEVCVLSTINDLSNLKKVMESLNDAVATVNTSCGLHIHLDMRHVTKTRAKQIARRMAKALPVLRKTVAPYRNVSEYCEANLSNGDRYAAINTECYDKYGTIEIRLHQGTLDFIKIRNWIMLLYKLSRAAKLSTRPSLEKLSKEAKLGTRLTKYYEQRIAAFDFLKKLEPSEVVVDVYQDSW
jgi:hypothetical protein